MLPSKYLVGLDADDYDIRGVYGIRHARKPDSWRIVCSYADGKRHKSRLFANMTAMGHAEQRGTWEWHHIVEGQHFADVDFMGRLAALYAEELPCVLISKEEHLAYNRLLHIREADELYRETGLPEDLRKRSAAAAAAARDRKNHEQLRKRVRNVQQMYRDAYSGDRVLSTIAMNVLEDALSQLH